MRAKPVELPIAANAVAIVVVDIFLKPCLCSFKLLDGDPAKFHLSLCLCHRRVTFLDPELLAAIAHLGTDYDNHIFYSIYRRNLLSGDLSTDHPIVAVVAFTTGDAACDRASTHHDRAAAVTGVIQAGDISMEASIKLLVYGGASNLRVVLKDCKVWRFKLMIYMVVEECILMTNLMNGSELYRSSWCVVVPPIGAYSRISNLGDSN
ncbi:hypothetical protein P8452_44919 [Trifolium repens]|nr:hypothetical protein P8452_44919 [Trifolium repens]